MKDIHFAVNDMACTANAEDQSALVHFVRDALHLKGTRYGCGEEQCGACVVLIDGVPRPSCQIELGHLGGKRVTTLEGVLDSVGGRRLAAAFERHQAAQCGFCLSGILVRASTLVDRPVPCDRQGIQEALAPHLCRCGAHTRMLRAIEEAVGHEGVDP